MSTVNLVFNLGNGGGSGTGSAPLVNINDTSGYLLMPSDSRVVFDWSIGTMYYAEGTAGRAGISLLSGQMWDANGERSLNYRDRYLRSSGNGNTYEWRTNQIPTITGGIVPKIYVDNLINSVSGRTSFSLYNVDNETSSGSNWSYPWFVSGLNGWEGFGDSGTSRILGNALIFEPSISNAAVTKSISGDWSITAQLCFNGDQVNYNSCGLILMASDGLCYKYLIEHDDGVKIYLSFWNDYDNFNSNISNIACPNPTNLYFKVIKSGVVFDFYYSYDGMSFVPFYNESDITLNIPNNITKVGLTWGNSYGSCKWIRKDWIPEQSLNNPVYY